MSKASDFEKKWKRAAAKAPAAPDFWAQIEEAREAVKPPERPLGGITAKEYAAKFGITDSVARNELEKLVNRGRLKRYPGLSNKYPAYYVVISQ